MRIKYHFSHISILITSVLLIQEVYLDIKFYNFLMESITQNGDIQPSLVAKGSDLILFTLIPVIISILLAILGIKRKNKHRRFALWFIIVTFIYILLPVSTLLVFL